MVVVMGGIAAGQLLLNLADPDSFVLFVTSSVLVSLAIVPVTLSASPTPDFRVPSDLPIRRVWKAAPLGIIGGLGHGVSSAALLSMGAVYASRVGMSVPRITAFMGLAIAGSVVLQWPLGALSDSMQRRVSILLVSLASVVVAVVATAVEPTSPAMLAVIFLLGGLVFPLYSLNLSHISDNMPTATTVGVSSLYVFVVGAGSILGPIAAAAAISGVGPNGLLWTIVIVQGLVALFGIARIGVREAMAVERQLRHSLAPARSGAVIIQLAHRHQRRNRQRTGS
jgi:MFS family permease